MAKHDDKTTATRLSAPSAQKPPFQAAVLVCRECEDRKNGPQHLDSRQVRKGLKQAMRDRKPKARVVESSCLGTCPKNAMMVVAVRSGEPIRGAAVQPSDDLEEVAALLAPDT